MAISARESDTRVEELSRRHERRDVAHAARRLSYSLLPPDIAYRRKSRVWCLNKHPELLLHPRVYKQQSLEAATKHYIPKHHQFLTMFTNLISAFVVAIATLGVQAVSKANEIMRAHN